MNLPMKSKWEHLGENGNISLALVPNQALYQAEPQPELIAIARTPVVTRVLTSRISQRLASASNFEWDEQLAPSCRTGKLGPCSLSPILLVPTLPKPTRSLS
jgi:hypothetical protein